MEIRQQRTEGKMHWAHIIYVVQLHAFACAAPPAFGPPPGSMEGGVPQFYTAEFARCVSHLGAWLAAFTANCGICLWLSDKGTNLSCAVFESGR